MAIDKDENNASFSYIRGKIFIKLSIMFAAGIFVAVSGYRISGDIYIMAVPLAVSLLAVLAGVYYAFLFKGKKVGYTICRVTAKKKDILGGLMSGFSFTRNRFYFEYEKTDGSREQFSISRGGFLNSLTVGSYYMVLHRKSRPLSGDNFLDFAGIRK